MRLNLILLATVIVFGFAMALFLDNAAFHSGPTTTTTPPTSGPASATIAPDFTAHDTTGKSFSLSDFKGHRVILNFWATWCAPCVVEFPKLVELARKNPDLRIVAISSDTTDATLNRFLIKHGPLPPNMIPARDAGQKITADIYGTYKLPESYLIDPSGKITRKIVGDTDWATITPDDFLKTN